ncbi:hypothetical protein BIW11_03353 [Tropilaelaps mercedesae]|uniref:Uncharacterized protein n=1 Tax=Tropilaelaps mercedesae TaxID=418985 RepID=A0A1V9XMV5_9ACAR|nr:hypothetical protein BIW11_03353 [Tropilaelaps mercedesae]
MEVKTETQRSLEWQLNELQKGLHDAEALDSSISDARALSETVAANMERGVGRHDHESATSILDEALKEIEVDSRPDVSDMKAVLLQPSEPVLPEVPCSQMSVQLPQTIVPNTSPENPNIKVDLPSVPLSFKIDPQRAMVANASDIRHIRVEVPKPALPIEIEQPLAVVTNTSDSSHIKYELPKMSLPIKVESPMTVMATTSESTRMKVDMPKQAQLPIKVETPHNVLTVEVPKVVSVVPTSCATSAAAVTAVSIPQAITLSSVANSPTVQGGTYRLKASGALGNPVVGAPLMVTGVVIPRAPLSSNLISFVDASGNMQLAAVASPIMNPTIQIRPGVVVNSAPPLVVRPPAPQIVSPSGPLGTIVPVSTLSTVQPPIFKSTVRAILPNKTTVKTIYPIKGGTTTMLNSEPKINDVQAVVRTSPAILEEPEEEQPPPPTLQPSIKEPSSTESKSEHHKNDSTSIVPSDSSPPIIEPTPLSKPLINEVCPPTKPEDEDKVNDVIWKILSVSSSQGVSKAGELAKTNLFNLVKTETNVVITAPSTAVQDILEELKKQFPDKKFVINYNASNTASSNLKNLKNHQ